MGITRSGLHKRRLTGGKRKIHKKKRKFELARQPAMTKLGGKKITLVRGRGGNYKHRALRLDTGNFSWASEQCTRKAKILDVSYNASNNELLRTKTLVKGCVVQVDATPFKTWFENHYGITLGLKKKGEAAKTEGEKDKTEKTEKDLKEDKEKAERRKEVGKGWEELDDQFGSGRLFAVVSSRPGQCGRCDGYILEGKELEFYQKQMQKKKAK